MNRRSFFQTALTAVGTMAILPVVARAARDSKPAASGAGPAFIDPNDQAAKAVHYVEKSKKPGEHCGVCTLYNMDKKETTVKGKKAASCALFPGKLVHADGYCTSFAKKA